MVHGFKSNSCFLLSYCILKAVNKVTENKYNSSQLKVSSNQLNVVARNHDRLRNELPELGSHFVVVVVKQTTKDKTNEVKLKCT